MGTIKELNDELPNMAKNALKKQLLDKLDPELKRRMYACGGGITVDLKNGAYAITACDEELEQSIVSDLRSKR
jgi:hypothetical protein